MCRGVVCSELKLLMDGFYATWHDLNVRLGLKLSTKACGELHKIYSWKVCGWHKWNFLLNKLKLCKRGRVGNHELISSQFKIQTRQTFLKNDLTARNQYKTFHREVYYETSSSLLCVPSWRVEKYKKDSAVVFKMLHRHPMNMREFRIIS